MIRSLDAMLKEVLQLKTDETRHGWVISLTNDERIVLINQHLLPTLAMFRCAWDEGDIYISDSEPGTHRMLDNIFAWTETNDAALAKPNEGGARCSE